MEKVGLISTILELTGFWSYKRQLTEKLLKKADDAALLATITAENTA